MHLSSFSERIDYLSALIDCDFLVIDDLGTENIYTNVTIECLLALVSERLAKKKHTIRCAFSLLSAELKQLLLLNYQRKCNRTGKRQTQEVPLKTR